MRNSLLRRSSKQEDEEDVLNSNNTNTNTNNNHKIHNDDYDDDNEEIVNDLSSSFYNSKLGRKPNHVTPSNSRRASSSNHNMRSSSSSTATTGSYHPMNTSQTNASIIQYLNTYNISSVSSSNNTSSSSNSSSSSNDTSNNMSAVQQLAHLNILLIGEKGAGKSSLLSTFHRALHQNYGLLPVAGVGNTRTMSFTKKKKGYFLNTCHTIKGYDTRGLESLLREEIEQFRAVRDGRALDDVEIVQKPYSSWTLWDHLYAIMSRNPAAILDPTCLNEHGKGESLIDVPHCVIFVVPANQRRVPTELEDFVNLFVEQIIIKRMNKTPSWNC